MPRPPKNNCDYFRHFTTMRNHRKVKALRNKFGQVLGYAFWSMLLEYLTESDKNRISNTSLEIEFFAAELGVSATEIRDMLSFCYSLDMITMDDQHICSNSLDEELSVVYEKRQKSKDVSSKQKRDSDGTFRNNTESNGVSATETTVHTDVSEITMPQIRVDKSRVEKSRKENQINADDFDWEFEKGKFLGDTKWQEDYVRKKGGNPDGLLKRIQDFVSDIELQEDFKTCRELKNHFVNKDKIQKNGMKTDNGAIKHFEQPAERI